MKSFVLTFFVSLFVLSGFSQNENLKNNPSSFLSASKATQSSYGSMLSVFNPLRQADGSVYLFEDWDNLGQIYTVDNRKLVLDNINLNVRRHTFETKIIKDSIFVFNFNDIERFEVNNRVFKNYYANGDNRVYEVLYDDEDMALLKGFHVKFIEGSANPMLSRSRDKYYIKDKYFLRENGNIRPFKLKKKNVMKMLNLSPEERDRLMNYVDQQDLSFKDEEDIYTILDHASTL